MCARPPVPRALRDDQRDRGLLGGGGARRGSGVVDAAERGVVDEVAVLGVDDQPRAEAGGLGHRGGELAGSRWPNSSTPESRGST